MMFYAQVPSSLGQILLSSNGQQLTGLYFVGEKDCPVIDGLPARRPEASDPTAGMMAGVPIKGFKVFRHVSGELFNHAEGEHPSTIRATSAPEPEIHATSLGERSAPHSGELNIMQDETPQSVVTLFRQTQVELQEYFAGRRRSFDIPLALTGTAFQKQVWAALLSIPYGEVVSYGDVARAAGLSARHGRPVGTAVGRNPVTIMIPCHRVLSGGGLLTGYSGGLERKFALLEFEGFSLRS